jgi:hypothetical protein
MHSRPYFAWTTFPRARCTTAHRRAVRVLVLLCLAWTSTALAQSISHDVSVTIPDVIGIRIIGGGPGDRAVTFDYAADPAAYLAATRGSGVLLPTSVNRFTDVQVNVTRRGRWSVEVVATPWTYVGSGTAASLPLDSVRVVRGTRSGLTQNAISGPGGSAFYWAAWSLSTASQRIASRTGATGGWRSMGFNGWDYELLVDGSEDPGSYTTVVTYVLITQ